MSGILKAVLVLVALAAIACSGAAAQSKAPPPAAVQDSPMLTEKEAISLVYTNILTQLNSGSTLKFCLGEETSATYKGDGSWVVRHAACTFVVNDRTGKVTGP